MRYYVSWKTTGYYRKDSLKLAARCPVSGCWPSCWLCYTAVLSLSVCDVGEFCQTVGWIKMKLGTEVGLDPGHTVLDEDSAPPKKGGHSLPSFRPMPVVAKRLDG